MTKENMDRKLIDILDINTIDSAENVSKILNVFFLIGVNVLRVMRSRSEDTNLDTTYYTMSASWWGVLAAFFIARTLKEFHAKAMDSSYNELLNNFNNLSNELGLKEPLELYSLYTYMYSNGYLSYNKSFNFGSSPDITSRMGSAVVNGQGVCRHISSLFTDILNNDKNNGIKAATIGVYAYDNDLDTSNSEQVSRSIDGNLFMKPLYKTIGNHAITICEYEGKVYAFDPTNETNLKILDEKKLIFRGYGLDCKYKDTFVNFIGKNTRDMVKILKERNFYIYSEDDLKKAEEFANIVINNEDLIKKFYDDNNDAYKDIAKRYSRYRK